MIYKISVPSVGEDVEEIRMLEWHGVAGHRFEAGDLIVEMETHKALVEIRAGQAGVLRRILAEAGEWARLGVPIALFSDLGAEDLGADVGSATDLAVEFVID
jgi:pyruvate/2-oxoglutarate dehydrogenase complex dihydrolipoamide acyltransferase (E2) component